MAQMENNSDTARWVAVYRATMKHRRLTIWLLPILVTASAHAQTPETTAGDSQPKVEFITVQKNVALEVLDWGGTGRPLILLAGQGNTAHVFDHLARKLSATYHAYGITRRGYGRSSRPDTGYSADRLGDDVLAVIDSLKIDQPVLIGHSIAGEELSSIGSRHPERVAGLVYLDAAYAYAFYDSTAGSYELDLPALRQKLDRLINRGVDKKLMEELVTWDLPLVERDLGDMIEALDEQPPAVPRAAPKPEDRSSFTAFHDWLLRNNGVAMPEVELRQEFKELPDHSVGPAVPYPLISVLLGREITAGERKYTNIRSPVLALFAIPHDLGPAFPIGPARSRAEARDSIAVDRRARALQRGIPSARVVRIPHANHYVFLTNESDVLRAINTFVSGLPRATRHQQ